MTATLSSEQSGTSAALRLRADVFDAWCAALGAENEVARAALVEVDRGTVRRWKLGETTPPLDVAIRVARRLDLKVEDLWEAAA